MKVKNIELNGFKSFSEKTILPLHNGITCIVGPNGCGKSNVVDAFKWVLGEQSAKSLRGEKMEEVIFQGSATKKQKGLAEVSLTMSRSEMWNKNEGSEGGNGKSPSAILDEIVVSRRLYRSGDSEYILNKKQCRLKDIRDIFLDTGLDVKSYSILDQGKITEIINAKPADRRFLIEEIAGVMKYKTRRAEALSKLESSKQNLQRINDIIHEVKRQINSLDRQVKKAERYKKLISELKEVELRTAKRNHSEFVSTFETLSADINRLNESDAAMRGELASIENIMAAKRLELAEKEKELTLLENELQAKERLISESEKKTAVLKANMENKKSDIIRLTGQMEESDIKTAELLRKIIELENSEKTIASQIDGIREEMQDRKERTAEIEAELSEKEAELEGKRKELFRISEQLSGKRNELHKLQASFDTLRYRESASHKDNVSITDGINEIENIIKKTELHIMEKTEELAGLNAEKNSAIAEIDNIRETLDETKAFIAGERELLAANISRLNSLKELILDRSLMDFIGKDNTENLKPVMLSDCITTGKDYESAIEAVMSEKINSILIETIEEAMSAVSIINEHHLGRTSLLFAGIRGNQENPVEQIPIPQHPAVIGRASDYISFENSKVQNSISNAAQNIFIVKDISSAFDILSSEHGSMLTLATLSGEMLSSDGWIFAGQGKEILKRKREIKELQTLIDEQQKKISGLEEENIILNERQVSVKETFKAIENAIITIEKELSLSQHSLNTHKEEFQRKQRRLSMLEAEIVTIGQEMSTLENSISAKNSEIETIEAEKNQINANIEAMHQSISEVKRNYEDARSKLTDLKLSMTSLNEKQDAVKNEINGTSKAIDENKLKKESAKNEISNAEKQIEAAYAELHAIQEQTKALVIDADEIRQQRILLREHIALENQQIVSQQQSLKAIRTQIDIITKELSDINAKAVEARLRIENIETGIQQKYGMDIKTEAVITEEFEASQDIERINTLNEKIRELGPVNLGTIEEYEELKTRYEFLTKQQQDLNMSIAELEEAISRINTTTRKKLREAYDSLRIKFSEVFTTLFGGGKADIVLTDQENILESGIDIIAQPPGKKLQNINLLSGGEKALTSVALLFAGFLIKPSPLCILDEADAPLDESNTVRFAKMIKGLSNETQFIVITHNRTTMEVADYIYGITMEEPGASKAISLQFDDAPVSN